MGTAAVLRNKGHSAASRSDARDTVQAAQVAGPIRLLPGPQLTPARCRLKTKGPLVGRLGKKWPKGTGSPVFVQKCQRKAVQGLAIHSTRPVFPAPSPDSTLDSLTERLLRVVGVNPRRVRGQQDEWDILFTSHSTIGIRNDKLGKLWEEFKVKYY